jgi:2-methylcitrate dehydratase PrpD
MTRYRQSCGLDRRSLLATAASAVAIGGLLRPVFAAPASVSPLMATLSSYMADAGERALPDEVIEQAKQHILDTFAAMISGSNLSPARAALKFARDYATDATATIAASQMTASPLEAALVNGMLAHSDETDDSNEYSQSHPGCAVIPAALATGEKFGADGMHFLRAVTLGYDIGPRVTISFGAVEFRDNSHKATHAIAGLFGAAAAAGSLAKLTAQQMRWLLDYSAQQSSGIGAWARDTSHIEKSFVFGGMTARSGVTAALVVQSGFTGVGSQARTHDRTARPALRDRSHQHQEMDGRLADSGATRRHERHLPDPRREARRREIDRRSPGPYGGAHGEQPRDSGHLPAAHDRRDAARQDRIIRGRAR